MHHEKQAGMSSPGKRGDLWLAERGRESQNLFELIRSSESKCMTLFNHRRRAVRTLGSALTSATQPVTSAAPRFGPNEGLLLRGIVTSLDLRSQPAQIKKSDMAVEAWIYPEDVNRNYFNVLHFINRNESNLVSDSESSLIYSLNIQYWNISLHAFQTKLTVFRTGESHCDNVT